MEIGPNESTPDPIYYNCVNTKLTNTCMRAGKHLTNQYIPGVFSLEPGVLKDAF